MPSSHSLHFVCPLSEVYLPVSQTIHLDDPASFANIPGGQSLHSFVVLLKNDPASHFFGATTGSGHVDEPPPFVNPLGQSTHIQARRTDLLPAGQSVHDTDLAAKAYVPAEQSVHVTDLTAEAYVPDVHCLQVVSLCHSEAS